MKRLLCPVLLLILMASPASAQISFDFDYVSGQIGSTYQPASASASAGQEAGIQALVAMTGASQTWDFTALAFDAEVSNPVIQEYIAMPDGSLAGAGDARIASATYAIKGTEPNDTPGDYYVTYHQLDGTGHRTFGTMIINDGQTTDNLYDTGMLDHPVPLQFGSTWTGSTTYSTNTGGFTSNISITRDGTANGWGTLVTPQGSYDALRYEYTQTLTTTVFGFGSSVTTRIILFATKAGVSAGITITNAGQGDIISATHSYNGYGSQQQVDPPAVAPASLGPVSGATGLSTSPTLSWGAVDAATAYDLQVATESFSKSGQTIVIDETGLTTTSFDATGLNESTTYIWRVRGTNEGGAGDWSATSSFTTLTSLPSPPAALMLLAPADAATDVALALDVSWTADAGAATYDVQVATDTGFTSLISDQTGLTGTSFALTGLTNATVYHWRVRGLNAGGAGPWTARSFTTEAAPVVLPGSVTLTAPADGATDVSTAPTLTWSTATDATAYDVQLATDAAFTALVLNESGLTGSENGATGLAYATVYYWRVRGTNADGAGTWASASFTTESAPIVTPGLVTLTSPAPGATEVETATTLTWTAASDATSYSIQVSENSDYSGAVLDNIGLTTTQATVSGLAEETLYYWRVRGDNTNASGAWVEGSFTTRPPALQAPGATTLSLPIDGAVDIAATATLSWTATADASAYDVEVSTDESFIVIVASTSTSGTSFEVGPLEGNTPHWWRVRATNAAGNGTWSTASFTTVSGVATEAVDASIPGSLVLHAAYPNPFNPQTSIGFDVPTSGHVRLSIWDVSGRHVATLVDASMPAGRYVERFQASHLKSGAYLVRLESAGQTQTSTLTLLK